VREGTKTPVAGAELEVLELGAGPPLLYLHGEDGIGPSRPLIETLAEHFTVIAPSHPAWGGSTRPRHLTETRDLAFVYADLLEQLDIEPLVVGASFGGWIAAELAIIGRTSLAGLVLVAPTGIKVGGREDRDFADIWMAGFGAEIASILYADPGSAPDMTKFEDDDFVELARAQEATARYCWKPYMHDPKLAHWLHRVTAPTLIVAGDSDHFVLAEGYYERYAELVGPSGAELRTLAGVGHRVEEEDPPALAELVVDFGKRITTEAMATSTGGD
jgi:pimeloyl-ACP methyl ester carboxylesterase